ncbi:methyltransferase type 11 [Desulfuribacillus stibiiarsenatis]|uniref:Arsenite methyltransferase n=1 Tax=Desulfuribacillus stibiiarsenatis TaxID=1390249 RepID=A0A1E5L4H6_9FIRM|nr:class I SAM-dependent methyltransferase [Desulfuribacillus stibiiarsenatis]OEH85015.1 methyltransferase type 11 [Desulfuribacillus stibiiarsenatis]
MNNHQVCSIDHAKSLDNKLRGIIQNPNKILGNYINKGMLVIDIGCGPGFFTTTMAELVGDKGKVIAIDLQEKMLEFLKDKIRGTKLEEIIITHQCSERSLELSAEADFILAFYMVHEVPCQKTFFQEVKSLIKLDGKVLVVEPFFHVSNRSFQKTKEIVSNMGFEIIEEPNMFMCRSIVLKSKS